MQAIGSIGIIGCGAMGSAIAKAVIRKKVAPARSVYLIDRDSLKLSQLKEDLDCEIGAIGDPSIRSAEIIILAVKPQDFNSIQSSLSNAISPSQLVISIMAGISTATLSAGLNNHQVIVRSMPNLPAQCGAGMTVYYCSSGVSHHQQQLAQFIFESFGRSLQVEREAQLDSATALSGTGPAYFYFLLEQLQAVAIEYGYSPAESALLLEQTMDGALMLWRETGLAPSELIAKVASKGGTTEAAFAVLKNKEVSKNFQDAIRAANTRAIQLGLKPPNAA